nr:uncharacterized protein LOC109162453 [Ipomoea batatas]
MGEELERKLSRITLREGVPDRAEWRPHRNGEFSFAAAKKFEKDLGGRKVCSKHWSRKIWAKHVPWKMVFLSWRVFKRKVPVDDVLSRFGYHLASRCYCCETPSECTLQHVFCTGDAAKDVWGYFGRSLGFNIQNRCLEQVCYKWWGRRVKNRLENFIIQRLPMVIIWELWVSYTQCKYGKSRVSVARIKYRVAKAMAECITWRWPRWDPFPPNWNAMMRRVQGFGVQKAVVRNGWCKPPKGWIKVNMTAKERSCGFFVRNAKGQFYIAGVYSICEGESMNELRGLMVQDVWAWCRRKRLVKVIFESDEPGLLKEKAMIQGGHVGWSRCSTQVNCLVHCVVDRCTDLNMIFLKEGSLPCGFARLMALEGIPHFVVFPGHDYA